ncbi:NUDIX domain-containing protein [Patescibacteria group bacterium]|nr:NUDIX domain-containing protein [Patescibacteria group bacterium]MBU4453293.1 NUDIX domain-containing protein [Patescibacteria group bacterium]MCG2687441.1 NUDIX hydrolase [Candidatus Parcubacteria bacterium]
MRSQNVQPKVGIGVVLVNPDGKVLVGKRKNSHAPYYSIPGGHLECGETFEQCAIREIKEETDIDVLDPKVIAVTNNLETYKQEGKHYISIILLVENVIDTPKLMEPEKCDGWLWVDPNNLPMPHFDASKQGIECYLQKVMYKKFR